MASNLIGIVRPAGATRPQPRPSRRPGAGTASPAPAARRWLTWPRLPAVLELATLGAGYGAPSLIRLAPPASRPAAFAHAAQLYHAEQRLGVNFEPYLIIWSRPARPWPCRSPINSHG